MYPANRPDSDADQGPEPLRIPQRGSGRRAFSSLTLLNDTLILFYAMNLSSDNKPLSMRRQKAFHVATGFALVAWVSTALVALLVATFGVIGLTGWGDYRYQVDVPVPGLSLHLGFQPSWGVSQGGWCATR